MNPDHMAEKKTAVFGSGCFWCSEAVFKLAKGVLSVEPGYAGGGKPEPTYEEVSTGDTGHAEVVRVTYDPSVISYEDLLTLFFGSHDPTTLNRQGADVGTQYRSIILYGDDAERSAAKDFIAKLEEGGGDPVVTEVAPLDTFWPAEDYHKDYFEKNKQAPYCQAVINPKLEKIQERFTSLLR